jgi:hypothetical protein
MPAFKSTKRNVVLKVLKSFGFTLEGNHGTHGTHIVRGSLSIPFPTYEEFDVKFLRKLLNETGITRREWEDA